jgi:O-antigen ligase
MLGWRDMSAVSAGQVCGVMAMSSFWLGRLASHRRYRWLCYALAAGLLLPLVLSFSRTAFVALGLTGLVYLAARGRRRQGLLLAAVLAATLLVVVLQRDAQWAALLSRSHTITVRLFGWQATWAAIGDHFWLGHGAWAPFVIDWTGFPLEPRHARFYHPHNVLLSIWYYAGLIGVLLAAATAGAIWGKFRLLLTRPPVGYLCTVLIFVLLCSLADHPGLLGRPDETWLWFWLPVMVALNVDLLTGRPERSENSEAAAFDNHEV